MNTTTFKINFLSFELTLLIGCQITQDVLASPAMAPADLHSSGRSHISETRGVVLTHQSALIGMDVEMLKAWTTSLCARGIGAGLEWDGRGWSRCFDNDDERGKVGVCACGGAG